MESTTSFTHVFWLNNSFKINQSSGVRIKLAWTAASKMDIIWKVGCENSWKFNYLEAQWKVYYFMQGRSTINDRTKLANDRSTISVCFSALIEPGSINQLDWFKNLFWSEKKHGLLQYRYSSSPWQPSLPISLIGTLILLKFALVWMRIIILDCWQNYRTYPAKIRQLYQDTNLRIKT